MAANTFLLGNCLQIMPMSLLSFCEQIFAHHPASFFLLFSQRDQGLGLQGPRGSRVGLNGPGGQRVGLQGPRVSKGLQGPRGSKGGQREVKGVP